MKTRLLFLMLAVACCAQSARHTYTVSTPYGFKLNTPFFSAQKGDLIFASVSCNFTNRPCLADTPSYQDSRDHHCREMPEFHKISGGWQEHVFLCRIGKVDRKIRIIAPGVWERAEYKMLVQDDSTIP